MEDVSALSPASSIDCFSDTELDVYEPPTNSKVNKRIDTKPDDLSCGENRESNLQDSEPESRDVAADVVIEESMCETQREVLQSDSHLNKLAEPVDSVRNETRKSDSCDMEATVESNPSQITATPPTTESEALNKPAGKSFESANWPIDNSKVMSANDSKDEAIDLNDDIPNTGSSQPLGRSDDWGLLKKPTVSFADDKSSSDNGVMSRSGSGLSAKNSVQSRKSIFSKLKSKSKDVSDNKSITPSLSKSSKTEKTVQSVNSNIAENWPLDNSMVILANDSKDEAIDLNDDIPNTGSSQPLGRSDDLGLLKKPTVSFADDKSSSDNGVMSRSGSGLSAKNSVQSRKSMFSILKSKSKDVSDNKSIKPSLSKSSKTEKTVQSGTSDGAEDTIRDEVVGVTMDNDFTPDILLAPESTVKDVPLTPQGSVTSKSVREGKNSGRSIRSTKEDKSVSNKTSKSVHGSNSDEMVVTIDKNFTPEVSIVPESSVESAPLTPQRSVTSKSAKGSKNSARSVRSQKEDKSVSNKTSKSLQSNLKKGDFSVSSPKLYGPPQRLPRWGGIPKPDKSVASEKNSVEKSAKQEHVHTKPWKEEPGDKLLHSDTTVKSEKSKPSLVEDSQAVAKEEHETPMLMVTSSKDLPDIENIVSPTLNLAEPPTPKGSDGGDVDADNAQDDDDDAHGLDATSTLSSKSSKPDESSTSKEYVADNEDVYTTEEVQMSEIPIIPGEETDLIKTNVKKLETNTQPLQVEVNSTENDPIKAVMEPFSPIEVPNCATIEDIILKTVSPTFLLSEEIEPENEREMAKSLDKAETNTMEVIQPKKVPKSQFWSFGRPKLSNELIPIDEHKPLKVEKTSINPLEKSVIAGQPNKPSMLTKVLSSKIGSALVSPKKAAVADSETSIEVEMLNSNSPRRDSNQLNFRFFKRSSLISPTKKTIDAKMFENSAKQKPEMVLPNDDDDTDASMIPFATIPVDESTVDAVAPPLEHDAATGNIENTNVGGADQQYNNIGMNTTPQTIDVNFTKNAQVLKVKQLPPKRFFGKKRDSNEKKRYLAKMMNEKFHKVERKRKEHQVKLSAMIDDKILVEDLHVNHSESQSPTKVTQPATYDKIPSVSNKHYEKPKVTKLDESETPIIVVDHRSSKKIEAIGKFESNSTAPCIRPAALSVKSETVNSADADDQLYTSDDAVTETELTQVVKLDVPCETDHVPRIPDNVIVDERELDSNICDRDPLYSSKKKNVETSSKDESSWMTTFVDWCTPKSTIDIKNWMDCGIKHESKSPDKENTKDRAVLKEKSKQCNNEALDEAIVNFKECHDFYAESLNLKGQNGVNEIQIANENHSSVDVDQPNQDWSMQLMEWISPKSKQLICESKAVLDAVPETEIISEMTAKHDIGQPIESQGTLHHEGTEIALTNFESPADNRQKSPYRGYLATKTMFGKSLRKRFGRIKHTQPMKPSTASSARQLPLAISETKLDKSSTETKVGRIPFRKLFRTEIAETKADANVPITEKRALKSILPKLANVPDIPATLATVHIDEVAEAKAEEDIPITEKRVLPSLAKVPDVPATSAPGYVEPPNSTLFTFTSDDTGTNEMPIVDTKSSTQKGCCDSSNIVNRMIGHEDDDNIISEQLRGKAVDDDVEESVKYLAIVKGKRHATRKRNDESVANSKDIAAAMLDKVSGNKLDHDSKDMEFQYRVCAVSDEAVEEIKSNGSEASFSMKFASFVSSKEEPQGRDSTYPSYDESLERAEVPAPNETNSKRASSKKLVWGKKAIPNRSTNRVNRRKEDDSVGVSFNSGNNSFDDDLSVAFAPAVGKWLW
jgi:hypothetical protein